MNKNLIFFISLAIITFSCRKTKTTCSNALDNNSCLDNTYSIDSTKIHRKVLIIGIDGFRAEAMQENITPYLYQLSQSSSVYYNGENTIEDHTVSGPNWSSLLTGVHWCKHQVSNNNFNDNQINDFPHFFSYLENTNSNINTVSIVNWLPINEHLASFHADHAPQNSINDAQVFELAEDALVNQNPIAPDVLFLHFDDPDAAGHGYGYSSSVAEYAQSLTDTDQYVQQLFSIIDGKRSNGGDWIVFIVSDHGGDNKGHGNGQRNENISETIFYAQHPSIQFSTLTNSSQVDLAPTILDFMGIFSAGFECKKDGISLIN